MASICWSSVSLLILLAFPFSATLISPLLGLLALPYFLAMASDLRYCGYKRLDVLRIYGFNLVLLPVNLAGTMSSIVQGITASKAAFARTPKVRNRTVVPPFFVIAPYLLIALAGATFYFAYRHDRVENMAYAALNVVLACYAAKSFIGLRNSVVDGFIHATSLLYKQGPRRRRRLRRHADQQAAPQADWRSVLEVGFEEPDQRTGGRRRTGPARPHRAAAPRARRGHAGTQALAAAGPGGDRGAGRSGLRRLHRGTEPGHHRGHGHPPDLVRALRRRHAHADLPVPERLGRRGPADGPRVRGRGAARGLHAQLGRGLQRWPRPISPWP